jgi:hypothetical protein
MESVNILMLQQVFSTDAIMSQFVFSSELYKHKYLYLVKRYRCHRVPETWYSYEYNLPVQVPQVQVDTYGNGSYMGLLRKSS